MSILLRRVTSPLRQKMRRLQGANTPVLAANSVLPTRYRASRRRRERFRFAPMVRELQRICLWSDAFEIDFRIARGRLERAYPIDPRLERGAIDIDDDEIVLGRHRSHLAASEIAE